MINIRLWNPLRGVIQIRRAKTMQRLMGKCGSALKIEASVIIVPNIDVDDFCVHTAVIIDTPGIDRVVFIRIDRKYQLHPSIRFRKFGNGIAGKSFCLFRFCIPAIGYVDDRSRYNQYELSQTFA